MVKPGRRCWGLLQRSRALNLHTIAADDEPSSSLGSGEVAAASSEMASSGSEDSGSEGSEAYASSAGKPCFPSILHAACPNETQCAATVVQ